mmetsp:Transcript_20069/g.64652  ORF Transcript_20069/g.64652 Transcript_20069/m.64652 type:complete len:406 (+) Transcript_20069:98-1315(+)
MATDEGTAPSADSPWSRTYEEARTKFREAAMAAGAELETIAYDEASSESWPGPSNEVIDVATLRGEGRLLLHSSGVHGVEGYAGSAIQVAFLRSFAEKKTKTNRCSIVLIHGVNASGMRESRRWSKNNVDLNRNYRDDFKDDDDSLYDAFHDFLNPPRPEFSKILFYAQAFYMQCVHGAQRAKEAVVKGQAKYPDGLFFRGTRLEPALAAVDGYLKKKKKHTLFFRQSTPPPPLLERAVHVDVHTGLGPRGRHTLIVQSDDPNPPELDVVRPTAADDDFEEGNDFEEGDLLEIIRTTDTKKSVSYHIKGGFAEAAIPAFGGAAVEAKLVQEFGTERAIPVLCALRDELALLRQCRRDRTPVPDPSHPIRARLREVFYPEHDLSWKASVLHQGLRLIHKAIAFLER